MVKKLKAEEIDIESLEQQYKAICDKLTEVRGLLEKADAKRVEPGEDRVKWNKVIDNLNRGRQLWPKIVRMLVDKKPEQLWILTVSGNANQIRLDGNCFSHLNVAQFMENLKTDPMVADVILIRTVAGGAKTTGGGDLVNFSLQIKLKQ